MTDAPTSYPLPYPPGFDTQAVFGTWFMGVIFDVLLTGAAISLGAEYYKVYSKEDRPMIRSFVAASLGLSVLRSVQAISIVWYKIVYGWGNYHLALTSTPWFAALEPILGVVLVLLAQTFFLTRLSVLLKGNTRWVVVIPIMLSMIVTLGGHIGLAVENFRCRNYLVDIHALLKALLMAKASMTATDFLVTAALCYTLWQSKTGIQKTDNLVGRLIILAWTTAFLPALAGLMDLVCYKTLQLKSSAYIAFALAEPKLYVVSMLVTLTARKALRGDNEINLSSYQLSKTGMNSTNNGGRHGARVNITTETIQFGDDEGKDHKFGQSATMYPDSHEADSAKGLHVV